MRICWSVQECDFELSLALELMVTGDWPGAALCEVVVAEVSVVGAGVLGLQPVVSRSAAARVRQAGSGFEIIAVILFTVFMGRVPFLSEVES